MVVLSLSARTPEALEKASRALADWLVAAPRDLRDVTYTLGIGRTAFPHRRAVVGAEAKALARALRGDAKATGEGRLANLVVAWEAAEAVDLREDHVDEAAMLDGDALGPTGRAGGVDDIGEVACHGRARLAPFGGRSRDGGGEAWSQCLEAREPASVGEHPDAA